MDADYSCANAKNIVDHLAKRNHLQEVIIVGIVYASPKQYRLHRTRDYTPKNSDQPGSYSEIHQEFPGGGPQFTVSIQSELIHCVDSHFRTISFRVLTGH